MEEFLILTVLIVILVFFFSLRRRIIRLEQFIEKTGIIAKPEAVAGKEEFAFIREQVAEKQPEPPSALLDYIKQQLAQGINKEVIKSALITNGWKINDIERAFEFIASPGQIKSSLSKLEPKEPNRFIEWLKEDWMMKLGAMLLLFGFGWLTTYAFLNNWIGSQTRITIGIIAGAIFILLGYWRIRKYVVQGGIFLALGSGTILLTVFAARALYEFFNPVSALGIMFLSVAFVAIASVKYNSRHLSVLSLILAGIAPLLTNAPETDHVGLFAYLFVTTLGAIWIVFLTGQRALTGVALVIISFYSAPHLFDPSYFPLVDNQKLLLFAYAFSALFFITNTVGIIKLQAIKNDLIIAAGNGLFLLFWIMSVAQEEWKSLIIATWMVIFLVGAFIVFKISGRKEAFYTYAGVAVAMLAAATSAELSGATLTIAYTVESGIIALITYLILNDVKIAEKMSLLLIGPIILSPTNIFSSAWYDSVIHKDFFVLFILALMLISVGYSLLSLSRRSYGNSGSIGPLLLVAGSIYAYILLWLSLHAAFENNNVAVMISLAVYTIIGLISYFAGLDNQNKMVKIYGGVLVGFVVIRLLLVDVWGMDLPGRIVTFFLIGALLISTAFISKKNK